MIVLSSNESGSSVGGVDVVVVAAEVVVEAVVAEEIIAEEAVAVAAEELVAEIAEAEAASSAADVAASVDAGSDDPPPAISTEGDAATGHIVEQIEMIKDIIDKGLGYEVNGSVYFDVIAYNKNNHYGILSGRKIEDAIHNTRVLDGQSDKKNPQDFALWKKADERHIMRWPSPWSEGFPGWHLECSVMSSKYLGDKFDIHGGGLDLKFPHHECEIAQSKTCSGHDPVNYWMHTNMLLLNGQKMAKSTGNYILPDEILTGENKILSKAFSSSVVRFFNMQANYRSILDFSSDALEASEKGYLKLMEAMTSLVSLSSQKSSSVDISKWK